MAVEGARGTLKEEGISFPVSRALQPDLPHRAPAGHSFLRCLARSAAPSSGRTRQPQCPAARSFLRHLFKVLCPARRLTVNCFSWDPSGHGAASSRVWRVPVDNSPSTLSGRFLVSTGEPGCVLASRAGAPPHTLSSLPVLAAPVFAISVFVRDSLTLPSPFPVTPVSC